MCAHAHAQGGSIDGSVFLHTWKALPPERQQRLPATTVHDVDKAKARLQAASLFVLAHRPVGCGAWEGGRGVQGRGAAPWSGGCCRAPARMAASSRGHKQPRLPSHLPVPPAHPLQVPNTPQQAVYVTGRVGGPGGAQIMLELRTVPGQAGVDVAFKSERMDLAQMAAAAVAEVLA